MNHSAKLLLESWFFSSIFKVCIPNLYYYNFESKLYNKILILKYSANHCCSFVECFMLFYYKRRPSSGRWQINGSSYPLLCSLQTSLNSHNIHCCLASIVSLRHCFGQLQPNDWVFTYACHMHALFSLIATYWRPTAS